MAAGLTQSPPVEALVGGLLIVPNCSQVTSCERGHRLASWWCHGVFF